MRYTVFDIETDGLLETVTLIHCLSYKVIENGEEVEKGSLTDYNQISYFIQNQDILVGHNIICYDIPVLKKILRLDDELIHARLIDTLGLSWYLYPMRPKHGLEQWGDELEVPKPVITDWTNLSIQDYKHRCESDVEINTLLILKQLDYLLEIYENDIDSVNNLINYLCFKLDCAREQQEVKCKVDIQLINTSLAELRALKLEKVNNLIAAMPRDIEYKEVSKPSKMLKKDETLSVAGIKWVNLLVEHGLPEDYDDTIMVVKSDEPGNPRSTTQLKNWLYTLGWEPRTFEYRKNVAGEVKEVAQVYAGDSVCSSIEALYDIEPALENLDMLSLINHRIGIFESYLDNVDAEGYVIAQIHGFTNTLRFRHKKPIVNLPKVFKFYGEQIRGAIIAPNAEHTLCGSDMCSLEDTTKQHYMYFFDPEYVTQMRVPGFDPHLDIAVLSGLLTEEQSNAHKNKEADYGEVRGVAKVVNFCLPTDNTEVLTEEGWKDYESLSLSDKIFSFNQEKKVLELVNIDCIPAFENAEVGKIEHSFFSFECTPNHRWLVDKRIRTLNNPRTQRIFVETKDLTGDCRILATAPYKNTLDTIGIQNAELLGWILSDGCTPFINGKLSRVEISQKKYKEEVENSLKGYKYGVTKRDDGVNIYYLTKKESIRLYNSLGLPFKEKKEIDYSKIIINMSFRERQHFLNSFWLADGGVSKQNIVFYQNRGNILNALKIALTLNGYKYTGFSNGTYKLYENMTVTVQNRDGFTAQKMKYIKSRNTKVFCVNNVNQTFIAKQGDNITLTGNSGIYGAGPPKIAQTSGMPLEQAQQLHKIYWKRNKSVKQIEKSCRVKTINEQMWLLNPVSGFWYSLRYLKDRFSTLNQGTGVYVFDLWIREMRDRGIKITLQYHDEVVIALLKDDERAVEKVLKLSIQAVNDRVKLNVPLDVDVQFGSNYAKIH